MYDSFFMPGELFGIFLGFGFSPRVDGVARGVRCGRWGRYGAAAAINVKAEPIYSVAGL